MAISLILGSVTFEGFEVPSRINFGGKQRIVSHTLASGTRIVDALGPDDFDIRFSGILSGQNATSRALQLDAVRSSGQRVNLSWGSLLVRVIVREFTANFESPFWVPFGITCVKVGRDDQFGSGVASAISEQVSADLESIASIGAIGEVATAAAEQALAAVGATVRGTSAWASAITVTGSLVTSCQQAGAVVDQELIETQQNGFTNASDAQGVLQLTADETYTLWQMSTTAGYWSQISKSLQNAST